MHKWFVNPAVVRLDVAGEWIDVKKRLTIGETRKAQMMVVQDVRADGRITPNLEMAGKAEVLSYLVGWSLRDEDGTPIPVSISSLDALDPEYFELISAAIATHVETMAKERAAEKNNPGGESTRSATSPSAA